MQIRCKIKQISVRTPPDKGHENTREGDQKSQILHLIFVPTETTAAGGSGGFLGE